MGSFYPPGCGNICVNSRYNGYNVGEASNNMALGAESGLDRMRGYIFVHNITHWFCLKGIKKSCAINLHKKFNLKY